MDGASVLALVLVAAIASIVIGLIIIDMKFGLFFDILPWRIIWPSKLKAYHKLRRERVNAGRFFDVSAQCGHAFELSGLELCDRLVSLGEYIQCPECFKCVKVMSIADGRIMTQQEKEKQAEDCQSWKEEMDKLAEYIGPIGGG